MCHNALDSLKKQRRIQERSARIMLDTPSAIRVTVSCSPSKRNMLMVGNIPFFCCGCMCSVLDMVVDEIATTSASFAAVGATRPSDGATVEDPAWFSIPTAPPTRLRAMEACSAERSRRYSSCSTLASSCVGGKRSRDVLAIAFFRSLCSRPSSLNRFSSGEASSRGATCCALSVRALRDTIVKLMTRVQRTNSQQMSWSHA